MAWPVDIQIHRSLQKIMVKFFLNQIFVIKTWL